jgi:heavy metal sensor kinase
LTIGHAALFTVLASGIAATFWLVLRSVEYGDIDAALKFDAEEVISNVQDAVASGHAPAPGAPAGDLALLDEARGGIPAGVVILTADGQVVASSGPAPAPADARRAASGLRGAAGLLIADFRFGGVNQRGLVQSVPATPGLRVLLSTPLTHLEHELQAVAVILLAVVAGLVVMASGLGYWLAGRALKPVGVMTALAREISERDLHRRIELSLPTDELGELAATFNDMLARLEKAFLAHRNFTADAAHELRAPLTLMRAELEAMLQNRDGSNVDEEAARALLAETDRLSKLADQLLLLAEADAGKLAPRRHLVDVADLIEETGDRWRRLADAKDIRLEVNAPDSGRLLGDAELLARLLDNLLDNAIRLTPPGGEIKLAAHPVSGDGWELHVADTGPGIPHDAQSRLFERFFRAEGARSRPGSGAGLGLALCAAIADAHGGSINLLKASTGAHLVVHLPGSDRR